MVRALRWEGLPVERARPVLDRLQLVSLDDAVLQLAAAIEPHVSARMRSS
ncbi:MAG: hypothetical protein J0H15_05490 [Xanthomonadales bacterium]|nr:hypothetical protein [Xanthomonadales bacterium]